MKFIPPKFLPKRKLRAAERKSKLVLKHLEQAADGAAELQNRWLRERLTISEVRLGLEQSTEDMAAAKTVLQAVRSGVTAPRERLIECPGSSVRQQRRGPTKTSLSGG